MKHLSSYFAQVKVTPGPSSGYILTPVSSEEYASCLCGSERKTFRWNMNPTALGEVYSS